MPVKEISAARVSWKNTKKTSKIGSKLALILLPKKIASSEYLSRILDCIVFSSFFKEFCVEKSKSCCEDKNSFGKDCQACPTNVNQEVCSGRGTCEGAGDRKGKGGCKCNHGYFGKHCDECSSEYFLEKEVSMTEKPLCTKCLHKCKVGIFNQWKGDTNRFISSNAKEKKANVSAAEMVMKLKEKSQKMELMIARNPSPKFQNPKKTIKAYSIQVRKNKIHPL